MDYNRKLIIPDDWSEDDGYCMAVLCIPNSLQWKSLVHGALSTLSWGRIWDRNTGSIKDAQNIARNIQESLCMDCFDELASAIRYLADKQCSCSNSGSSGSAGAGPTEEPPIDVELTPENPFPPDFPDQPTYDIYKCKVASFIVDRMRDDIQRIQKFNIWTVLTVGAVLLTPMPFDDLIVLVYMLDAAGFISGGALLFLDDAENVFANHRDKLVCALMNASSVGQAKSNLDTEFFAAAQAESFPGGSHIVYGILKTFASTDNLNHLFMHDIARNYPDATCPDCDDALCYELVHADYPPAYGVAQFSGTTGDVDTWLITPTYTGLPVTGYAWFNFRKTEDQTATNVYISSVTINGTRNIADDKFIDDQGNEFTSFPGPGCYKEFGFGEIQGANPPGWNVDIEIDRGQMPDCDCASASGLFFSDDIGWLAPDDDVVAGTGTLVFDQVVTLSSVPAHYVPSGIQDSHMIAVAAWPGAWDREGQACGSQPAPFYYKIVGVTYANQPPGASGRYMKCNQADLVEGVGLMHTNPLHVVDPVYGFYAVGNYGDGAFTLDVIFSESPIAPDATQSIEPVAGEYVLNSTSGISPGDIIELTNDQDQTLIEFRLDDLAGTAQDPIVIRNATDKQLTIDGSKNNAWMHISNCQHIILQGIDVSGNKGIKFERGLFLSNGTTNIQFHNLENAPKQGTGSNNAGAKIALHADDAANDGHTFDGLVVQDCYIHDCNGEGIYFGSANNDPHVTYTTNAIIRHNTFLRCSEGLSVLQGTNAKIYNNCIRDVLGLEDWHHLAGIILDGSGQIYNNYIENAQIHGISLPSDSGDYVVDVFDNVINGYAMRDANTNDSGIRIFNNGSAALDIYNNVITRPVTGGFTPKPVRAITATGLDLHDNEFGGYGSPGLGGGTASNNANVNHQDANVTDPSGLCGTVSPI